MKVKYDIIGNNYNQTRKADAYLAQKILHHLHPDKKEIYLDIGCGTGNYTSEFQQKGFQFIGIDPSEKMLLAAKQKNKAIQWKIGTAENTHLNDNSIDGIIASLTIHHWENLTKSFSELYRILKNNSNMVIFTSTPTQMKGYWLNHYFPKMMQDSINQMPSKEKVKKYLSKVGFEISNTEAYTIQPNLQDMFLYCGKQNPSLYLNPKIRNGISSFSSLANKNEVHLGLKKLGDDIATGKINKIMKYYQHDLGDYLFIIAKKN